VMTAVGLLATYESSRFAKLMDVAGAMSLEALQGSRKAFDPLIPATRRHPGEAKTSRNLLKILGKESEISNSHTSCTRVQDAYSLRCMPAVHGAAKDTILKTVETLQIEANSSTDNPLVFPNEDKILSCGNFHGEPVAFALDFLGIAMSAMSSISECRIEKLINPNMSGLPAFLAKDGGLNSGMMIVQVAAASLVSENKILSHPASVDSIPTSADKEDHVSMGTIAARKLKNIVNNAENILAMELLCAAQALDFLKPLNPAGGVKIAYDEIRKVVPFASEDRVFAKDIEKIRTLLRSDLLEKIEKASGDLEV
ncbi:MAG: aromatic amino acid lyase, partial [Bdellovibrionales bacterium]|nr:aromatic amino acid lyase [Bdellovibrionales bacterium]